MSTMPQNAAVLTVCPHCKVPLHHVLFSDFTGASSSAPTIVPSPVKSTFLNQTSNALKAGAIAWAPCECCRGSVAECDQSAEQVLGPSLQQLDVKVVLEYGCLSLEQAAQERVLKYPPLNLARRLQASNDPDKQTFGSAQLDQVCSLCAFRYLLHMSLLLPVLLYNNIIIII
jgi:hypothetical protein